MQMLFATMTVSYVMIFLEFQGLLRAGANFFPEPDADDFVCVTSKVHGSHTDKIGLHRINMK